MELVISFSGGKDSQAMLAFICEKYPDHKKHVVFADTGWEHDGIIEWCRQEAGRFGLPLHVVRNPNKDFFKMVRHRKKFPGMSMRQCTSDLKTGPIMTWIRRNVKDPVVINCVGLRAEESAARAKKPKLSRNKKESNSKRVIWNWNPIHDWSEYRVRGYLIEKGIHLHPAYQYLKRLSCRVCIFMNDHDLRQVKKNDPGAIELVSQVEKEIGFNMMARGSMLEILEK